MITIGICRDRRVLLLPSFLRIPNAVLSLGPNAYWPPDLILRSGEEMALFRRAHSRKPNKTIPGHVALARSARLKTSDLETDQTARCEYAGGL